MSRADREIAELKRQNLMFRRLLAIAVHRLGGEMKIDAVDMVRPMELGMDSLTSPTVVTGFEKKE